MNEPRIYRTNCELTGDLGESMFKRSIRIIEIPTIDI